MASRTHTFWLTILLTLLPSTRALQFDEKRSNANKLNNQQPGMAASYGVQIPGLSGYWFTSQGLQGGKSCNNVCAYYGLVFDVASSSHTGNAAGMYFYPSWSSGASWTAVECSSISLNQNFAATGLVPDGDWANSDCLVNCACKDPPTPSPTPSPTPLPTPEPTPAPPTPAPTPPPTAAPTPCDPSTGTCTIMEDPHIEVFDGGQVSLLKASVGQASLNDYADKWLVKSNLVSIQARYQENRTELNHTSFVRSVAIGGPFLKGNKLIIGSLLDEVTWNNAPILEGESSSFYIKEGEVFVNASRTANSRRVENLAEAHQGVNIDLPLNVTLIVNRQHAHVNVAITMSPQEGGQDGLCGNYNNDVSDDSLEFTTRRFQVDVPSAESLF